LRLCKEISGRALAAFYRAARSSGRADIRSERGGAVAELRVERKRPNIWRWIVLLILVALLVWALVEFFGREEATVIEDNPVGALRGQAELAPSLPAYRNPPPEDPTVG
jgi:hypothetical protein